MNVTPFLWGKEYCQTRIHYHLKADFPKGQPLHDWVGRTAELNSEIIAQTAKTHKLLELKVLYDRNQKRETRAGCKIHPSIYSTILRQTYNSSFRGMKNFLN